MLKSMIDSSLCYRKLGMGEYIQEHFSKHKDSLEFQQYYGFDLTLVPEEVYMAEPVISNIPHKILHGVYIKLDPYRNYMWHQDSDRNVSINMLMTPSIRYHTLFGRSTDSEDQIEFLEMTYEPNQFYLFNANMMHSVINFEEPRYLFSIMFEDKGLTYDQF